MGKSSRRNQTEGTLDRIGGSVMALVGRLTGKPSTKAKGRTARLRGAARSSQGNAKRRARG